MSEAHGGTAQRGRRATVQSPAQTGHRSEATRYLCAAAHIDADFRRVAMDELLFHPRRAVAPSYGIDVVPVLLHATAAHARALVRDGVLTVILVITWFVAPSLAFSLLLYSLISWWLVRLLSQSERDGERAGGFLRGLARLLPSRLAAALLLLGTGAAAGVGALFGALRPTNTYGYTPYGPSPYGANLRTTNDLLLEFLVVVLAPLCAIGTVAAYRLIAHHEIVTRLQPEEFRRRPDPAPPTWARSRLAQLDRAQYANVTYVAESAAAEPYVGSGRIIDHFAFTIPLRRRTAAVGADDPRLGRHASPAGASQADLPELTTHLAYEELRADIIALRPREGGDDRTLSGLRIQDRVYVSGRLRPDSAYLDPDGRLRIELLPDEIERVSRAARGAERRYLVARAVSWGGELETTIFFYVAIAGDMLYIECDITMLPPIAEAYHAIDSWERLTGRVIARHVGGSVLDLIRVVPVAPFRLLRAAGHHLRMLSLGAGADRAARDRLSLDYGARLSLRDLGAGTAGWFAATDSVEIQRLIIRQTVSCIADLLNDYGYDTSEFEARANVVINNSTTNLSGATIHGSTLATGTGSNAAGLGTSSPPAGGSGAH